MTYRPADPSVAALAMLTTTAFGRSTLEWADAASARSALGVTAPDLSGYATTSALTTALAGKEPVVGTVNTDTGTFGGVATVPQISVNGKGQITGVAAVAIAITKAAAGLGNVDNTSDAAKPVSTAQQTALDLKANTSALSAYLTTATAASTYQPAGSYLTSITSGNVTTALGYTPTSVTGLTGTQSVAAFKTGLSLAKADVGLANVDNTADSAKPVSTAQQTALNLKANIASPQFTGTAFFAQPTPTALSATTTLTIAQLLTLILTVSGTTAKTLTLPTGTLTDAGVLAGALPVQTGFEWYVINTGTSTGAITMAAGTGHTYVGSVTVAIATSARFLTVKTATNTFVTYRIG